MEKQRLEQEKRDLQRNSNPNVINAQPTPPESKPKETPVLKKEKKKKPEHFTAVVPGSKASQKAKAKKANKTSTDKG
ncbi:MAG: hypothetical protein RLZZ126_1872 [Pseudomonadota bacterium]